MARSALDIKLFENQQKSIGTDCSFIFNVPESPPKVINAHKCVLSAVSQYFATNFKSIWKEDEPITITTFDYNTFEHLIRGIYVSNVEVPTLQSALDLYEAAHFYQITLLVDLVRNEIPKVCYDQETSQISQLTLTAWKFQDFRLIEYSRKYFGWRAYKILQDTDFMKISAEVINSLFQIDRISATEVEILDGLEKYVESNPSTSLAILRPAICGIRFGAIPKERIMITNVLSKEEKDYLLNPHSIVLPYLSRNACGRQRIPFFFRLTPDSQKKLESLFSEEFCLICETRMNEYGDGHGTLFCYDL